ncbi:Rpn family recombination-promoting nuclease/putative transposase [Rickettsia hoogstraalii]|uniref:Rpn family recombination-promoting nuclease/putative transposase n=1 Tax=Rickettsia hoogstraalii TaxID=467174 RepID=UPI002257BC6C|nr:Rpn family recombination-promoting nuclease/putative transposase [Rickettsia hoogstraalii]MCX4084158.1 Rpn family recombination-promoting nuclease/putative transposase [Rickettsia hoogstraalii]
MTNEEHNQKQQQTELENSDVSERPRHDELFKKVMSEPVAAREFLEHYLPVSLKNKINLNTIKIEKESFITEDLRKRFSDVVYSVYLKNDNIKDSTTDKVDNDKAYVYALIEHQSSSDYWMAFRLWQYMLLLCERHISKNHNNESNTNNKQERGKLPLICPIVVYANDKPYNAPRSFWELFEDSKTAKELMSDEYLLVDLQKQSDDEIEKKKHLGMMEYMLKHIKARDILNLWQSLLEKFESSIEIDKANGFIYIKWLLWYSDAKVSEDKQVELAKIIAKHLNKTDQEGLMRTIADKYIDEGIAQGMQIGRNEGMQIGVAKGKYEVAKNMLSAGSDISFISKVTGFSISEINQLLKS